MTCAHACAQVRQCNPIRKQYLMSETEMQIVPVNTYNQVAPVKNDSPRSTRTRAEILAKTGPDVKDNPAKSLAAVIKGHLKDKMNLKGKELSAEYARILREDTYAYVLGKIEKAKADGYTLELRPMKDTKDGQEKFGVNFIPPKAPKRLTQSEQDKVLAAVGGANSAIGKQVLEQLTKSGMLAMPKVVNVEVEKVS